jgi:hypothetical protein
MLTALLDTADRRTRIVYRCAIVLVKGEIGLGVEWRTITLEESLKSA